MADIDPTEGSVAASGAAIRGYGIAGEAITAGTALYVGPTGLLFLGDANADASSEIVGIALNDASAGQPCEYAIEDPDFTIGATLSLAGATAGIYILSASTGGKICPQGDLAATMFPVVLLCATSSTKARLRICRGSTVMS